MALEVRETTIYFKRNNGQLGGVSLRLIERWLIKRSESNLNLCTSETNSGDFNARSDQSSSRESCLASSRSLTGDFGKILMWFVGDESK